MNLRGGNQASSPSTRGCTVIPPPDRMPLLPRGHCEAQLYLVIAKRVPLLSLRGAQPFPVIARSAATKQSPSKVIATPCIQRGAGLAMTEGSQCEARPPFRHCEARPPLRHCEARRAEAISWTKEIASLRSQ